MLYRSTPKTARSSMATRADSTRLRIRTRALLREFAQNQSEIESLTEHLEAATTGTASIRRKIDELDSTNQNLSIEISVLREAVGANLLSIYPRKMHIFHSLRVAAIDLRDIRRLLRTPKYQRLRSEVVADIAGVEKAIQDLLSQIDQLDVDTLERDYDALRLTCEKLAPIHQLLLSRHHRQFLRGLSSSSDDPYDRGLITEGSFEFGKKR